MGNHSTQNHAGGWVGGHSFFQEMAALIRKWLRHARNYILLPRHTIQQLRKAAWQFGAPLFNGAAQLRPLSLQAPCDTNGMYLF